MIKIIPYGQRELTRKSLAKLWNLFPNDEFCMVIPNRDLDQFHKAKRVAYYYTIRNKDFSVELDPTKLTFELEHLLRIGVRKFYFPWQGIERKFFFYSCSVLQHAIWLIENYKDTEVTIIYEVPYPSAFSVLDLDQAETSIVFLSNFIKKNNRLHGRFRMPHPWYGEQRIKKSKECKKLALREGVYTIEEDCGCLTVASNTNIYCCPFCERKKRKKFFGSADRDKYVSGTIDKGVFRDVICNCCKSAKNHQFSYINRG